MSNSAEITAVEREIRAKARRRARSKIGLMWHFAIFVMTNMALFEIDQNFTPRVQWFIWPLCAWSVGLLLHAFAALSSGGFGEDLIRAEVEKEKRRRGLA